MAYDPAKYRRCLCCKPDKGLHPLRKITKIVDDQVMDHVILECDHLDLSLGDFFRAQQPSDSW